MPEVKIETAASRGDGVFDGMHPVIAEDGDGVEVILLPDDLTRGRGNFLNVGPNGNPEGFSLVQLPSVTGHDVFMGTLASNKATKQNTTPIPVYEASYLANGPLATDGDEPDQLQISSLPRPAPPTIRIRSADVAGYPASTPESPYWIAISGYRAGSHTNLSYPVRLPPLAQGQCFRVKVPEKISEGATHIGWWLSQPGSSTASTTGQMRLQKLTRIGDYVGEIDFTGPYVYSTVRPSETALDQPGLPIALFSNEQWPCRIGTFMFRATAANDIGESFPSGTTPQITVQADVRLNDAQGNPKAGYGRLKISRGYLPPAATGWYLYVFIDTQWNVVYNKFTGEGLDKPFPLSTTRVETGLWEGSGDFGTTETMIVSSRSLPTQNTSEIPAPDGVPEAPTPFGATRPPPGQYFARQLDRSEDDDLSPLSDAAYATVGEDEVMEVVFSNPINKLNNATFVSKGADGYPLGYSVTGTKVELENGELIMEGSGNGVVTSDAIPINTALQWSVGAFLKVEPPKTGVLQGIFEAVLREINASGVYVDTVLKSVSAVGEQTYYVSISRSSSPAWQQDTVSVQILYRFSASSNMVVKVSRQQLQDYSYSFRRREPGTTNSSPAPETTASPSGGVVVEPSPQPATSPETTSQVSPDRPISSGVLLDTQAFSTLPGSPWVQDVTGSTLTVSSGKLVCQKTSAGVARANISRTFAPEAGLEHRHSLGISANGLTIPTLPSNGAITLLELRRPEDGAKYGWIDADTRSEVAKLLITSAPVSSGNVSTTLDEGGTPLTRNTAVDATREQATLTIDGPPTSDGYIGIGVGGAFTDLKVTAGRAGLPEIVQLEITRGAAGNGVAAVRLGAPHGSGKTSTLLSTFVYSGDSPQKVANRIRQSATNPSWQNEPWLISGTGKFVTFTSKYLAPTYGGHRFIPSTLYPTYAGFLGSTLAQGRMSVVQAGIETVAADTANSIATSVADMHFEGYKTTLSGSEIVFDALEPGARTDASFDARSTGVLGSMTTNIQGSRDTLDDVASKIVATYSGNAYHSVTRSGPLITISALSAGPKQDATFSAGITGTQVQLRTTIQGSADIVAYVKDRFGTLRQRRLFSDITNSTVYNLGLSSSGCGYPPTGLSQAAIQLWGSTATASKTLMGLFEDVDLGGYPAGTAAVGVSAETSNSLTWEVRIDEVKVTDRGEEYYRYHDYRGRLLNQIHFFFPPNLLPSEGFGIQGFKMAVLPETEYTASIFARWTGFTNAIEPLYLYCVTPEDEVVALSDLSGPLGVNGTSPWQELPYTFTTPPDCYELRLDSKTVAAGELVIQEFCPSLGDTPKRTDLYATYGSYISTLSIETPKAHPDVLWGRMRKRLGADIETPSGTDASILYRARDTGGIYGTPVSDSDLLEQKNELRVDITASGDALKTPIVRTGSPSAEYVLIAGGGYLATLLKSDRTEFGGGAIFSKLNRYAEPPEVIYQILPGRRALRYATYPPVGNEPPFELQVFTPQAKKYLEDRSGLVDLVIEAWGKIVTIRPIGPIRLESQNAEWETNGTLYGHYVGTVPESQVIDVRDFP